MNTRWLDEVLTSLGYTSRHINEKMKAFLEDEGFPQQLNEAWFQYLRSVGGTGSLTEMLFQAYVGLITIGASGGTAPVITGVPTISGTTGLGDVLTASPASVTGTPSPTRTWQWYRDGVAISGATNSTYTIVAADYGASITVTQTETNIVDVDTAESLPTDIPDFDPATLFALGESGAWFRPNYLDSMYQVTNLTTVPSTSPGDPVAFIASQAAGQSPGANLVTNGTFDSNATGWTLTSGFSWSSGAVQRNVGVEAGGALLGFNTQIVSSGRTYLAGYTRAVTAGSAVKFRLYTAVNSGTLFYNPGPYNDLIGNNYHIITNTSNSGYLSILGLNSSAAYTVDDVFLREITGIPARQATGANMPLLRQKAGSGVYYIENVSSDSLNWTAPAGTYSIAYVTPDGTVTILTGQSLSGSTNIMLASQIVEYVAVNRALTSDETDGITAYLERVANPT